jgi:hypothetical protein
MLGLNRNFYYNEILILSLQYKMAPRDSLVMDTYLIMTSIGAARAPLSLPIQAHLHMPLRSTFSPFTLQLILFSADADTVG